MKGLYVHVPFCARKCDYCDFYSLPGRGDSIEDYCGSVVREARLYAGARFDTVYLGGGTPGLLGPRNLLRLVRGLGEMLDLSGLTEATIELNPESTTHDLLLAARATGINRLSFGVQSLSDTELGGVGRIHTASRALEALEQGKRTGFRNISADVIIGLPGQEKASLIRTLETLAGLGLTHISAYCLSVEKGTPLASNVPQDLPGEDEQADLFEAARSLLAERGFAHYEISNFALPGYECRHNLNYWWGGEYVGLGPAAASHLDGRRWRNRADLGAYLADPTGQVEGVEDLDPPGKLAEEAMLRLRLVSSGIDITDIASRYQLQHVALLRARLDRLVESGSLLNEGTRYRIAPSRVLTSNPILAEVVAG